MHPTFLWLFSKWTWVGWFARCFFVHVSKENVWSWLIHVVLQSGVFLSSPAVSQHWRELKSTMASSPSSSVWLLMDWILHSLLHKYQFVKWSLNVLVIYLCVCIYLFVWIVSVDIHASWHRCKCSMACGALLQEWSRPLLAAKCTEVFYARLFVTLLWLMCNVMVKV